MNDRFVLFLVFTLQDKDESSARDSYRGASTNAALQGDSVVGAAPAKDVRDGQCDLQACLLICFRCWLLSPPL